MNRAASEHREACRAAEFSALKLFTCHEQMGLTGKTVHFQVSACPGDLPLPS